jgi:hypothetical protein
VRSFQTSSGGVNHAVGGAMTPNLNVVNGIRTEHGADEYSKVFSMWCAAGKAVVRVSFPDR